MPNLIYYYYLFNKKGRYPAGSVKKAQRKSASGFHLSFRISLALGVVCPCISSI